MIFRSYRWLLTHPVWFSLAVVSLVFVVDLHLPLGVAAAVPYTFAVLIALNARPRSFGPWVAVLCAVLTILKMEIITERGATEYWKVVVNRGLAIFAIGMTTFLGILRRRAEDRLREHDVELTRSRQHAMLAQVATALAHELNQPLAAVCLQADIAQEVLSDSVALRESLDEIAVQAQRAAQVVRSLRSVVRGEGHFRAPVRLEAILENSARIADWSLRRKSVTLTISPLPRPIQLVADAIALEQVFLNLIQNSIDAIDAAKAEVRAIQITTLPTPSGIVLIDVQDSGPGVDHPQKLFERFQSTKPRGMGLGLVICREIVESHGGKLWLEAAKPHAIFRIQFPESEV
jgi:C4-dicarboxylate-specific signal transduction histidine kinase